jgi:hypothetical protein
MRDGWKGRWGWRVSAVVLIVGLLGTNVVSAQDDKGNPFDQISSKLDKILNKLNSGGSGGDNSTLRWDQNLPTVQRFVVLAAFSNAAVLDKNTGLVWEQSPANTPGVFQDGTYACANKNVGGQKGWRLPAIPELASLIDPTVGPPGPTIPAGSPFVNVQPAGYWSASSHAVTPTTAWVAFFGLSGGGQVPPNPGDLGSDNKAAGSRLAWCVRGPMNADMY